MKANIITKLEDLLTNVDISAVANKIKDIQREYETAFSKEMEKAKQEFVDEGGKARDFIYSKSVEDTKIIDLFDKFRSLKKQYDNKIADEQGKNLIIKQEIINDINSLSGLEVNVGSAIKKLQELQLKWKETGAISTHKYKELQADYSKAVENFNYNLNIYRQLQDHDLKKNVELKQEVLTKMNTLLANENVKEIEQLIKIYRNDWEEIGPVAQENWTELKSAYKTVVDAIYAKVKGFYNEIEGRKKDNLELKKALVEKAKEFLNTTPEREDEWKTKTEALLKLQEEYKGIGYTEKPAGDVVYKEFREACDQFFDRKKEFYSVLKEKVGEIKKQKISLIEKAEALQNETTWKETSEKLIRLQDSWKKLANAGAEESRLFQRFRKACNAFFDAKKAHFDAQDAQFTGNLELKEAILTKVNAFTLTDDANADRASLKGFSDEWNAAGMVPFKEKQRLNEGFYKRLDELYDSLITNQAEKFAIKFQNKLERFKGSADAENLLRKEKDFLRKSFDEINNNIRTYENNMGFFKNSKGKSDFMIEIENKIEVEKNKLKEFQQKIKLVNEAIDSLKVSS
ncbi:MAG: DUF349 domain-containing protein [Bacteroidota bacterium]|nr:DUF349 domain-containing protein [Bacteroidota bacterium]